MKQIVLIFFISVFVNRISGQTIFSNVDTKLDAVKTNNSTDLKCSNAAFSIKFQLKQRSIESLQGNFAFVDSQVIQISPLEVSNYKKELGNLGTDDQKQLLEEYSKYELDYFKNELKFEIIKPTTHWVTANSRTWLVWYFRVGNLPADLNPKMDIQLFASTVIGNKILTINAPVPLGGNFARAAYIVNEMMETLTSDK